MTLSDAIEIRTLSLHGKAVAPDLLQTAIAVIASSRESAKQNRKARRVTVHVREVRPVEVEVIDFYAGAKS